VTPRLARRKIPYPARRPPPRMAGASELPLRKRSFQLLNASIKRRAILIIALLFAEVAATAGEFTRSLTPENLRATGLGKLTPKELAELELLIESYRTGAIPAAAASSDPAPSIPAREKLEARADKAGKGLPEWVGALIALKRTEESKTKAEALESRLAGEFSGWDGRTNFKLENGQVWTQAHKDDSYSYTPVLKSPKVRILPGAFGTFWMEIEGVNQRVRIRPVRLE
jgi:hypothetical protein